MFAKKESPSATVAKQTGIKFFKKSLFKNKEAGRERRLVDDWFWHTHGGNEHSVTDSTRIEPDAFFDDFLSLF